MLVDTHCHLDRSYFPEGPGAVLARARAAGVRAQVVIGVGRTLEPAREAVGIAKAFDHVVATVGVHPHDAAAMDPELWDELESLCREDEVVAIGEAGLDFHYDKSPRDRQREAFRRMIALARQLKKPLVIHTREAADETLETLRAEHADDVGGVIHCFSEDQRFAEEALQLGFELSFSGIVTFKSSTAIQQVAAWAPLDRILVETDAPYLAPVPLRGKPNEPAYVVHTARRVAELRGISLEELAAATTQNAIRRFGPKLAA